MADKPARGSNIICAISPTKNGDIQPVTVPIYVDDNYDPPRLIIELPDRALRDLGVVTVDGTVSIGAGTAVIGGVKEVPDATSTYAPSSTQSTAYEASRVIKNAAGQLFSITGYNSKTSAQFIQVHNTTSVPSDTAVPILTFTVQAATNFSLDCGKFGKYFSTGITVCNSSTGPTKTIGASDCWFSAEYA